MGNVVKMLSRHLFGWMLTITFLLSGLVAVGAVLAWLIRSCWQPDSLLLLSELGFNNDIKIAFFPAFLALIFWMIVLIIQQIAVALRKRIPPLGRVSYLLLIMTIVLGFFTLLGIGDVALSDWVSVGGLPESWHDTVNHFLNGVATVLTGLFAAVVAPYLLPTTLLRSGATKGNTIQNAVFNIAGYGLLFGAPLMVFYFLAQENVSGAHEERVRDGELASGNLTNFREFVGVLGITMEGEDEKQPAKAPEKADTNDNAAKNKKPAENVSEDSIASVLPPTTQVDSIDTKIRRAIEAIQKDGKSRVREWIRNEDRRRDRYDVSIPSRCAKYVESWFIGRSEEEFERRLQTKRLQTELHQEFATNVTRHCLTDPALFNLEPPKPPLIRLFGQESPSMLLDGRPVRDCVGE